MPETSNPLTGNQRLESMANVDTSLGCADPIGSYPLTSIDVQQQELPGGYQGSDDNTANFVHQC
jgi:hypothetical protein